MAVDALSRFGTDCQIVAGRAADSSATVLKNDLDSLVADLPSREQHGAHFLGRALLSQLLARLASSSGFTADPELARHFILLSGSLNAGSHAWLSAFSQLVDRYFTLVERQHDVAGPVKRSVDARVREVLAFIETHFADPQICLRQVAEHVGLSIWYVSRALKQLTGDGFVVHLRRCRVAAAAELLIQTSRSVKEIAFAVGYRQSGQLIHDFGGHYGLTPTAFRKKIRSAHSA